MGRRLLRRGLLLLAIVPLLAACDVPIDVPIVDPARWDPTMYCKMFPEDCQNQGPEDEVICLTPDGHVFKTGQREASSNGLICDHVGMGEG